MDVLASSEEQGAIGIVVKTVNNQQIQITLPKNIPVAQLKTKVKDSTSIPEDRQRLIYRGRVLEDHQNLDSYNVEDGHTIHMVARPQNYQTLQQNMNQQPARSQESRDEARRVSTASLLPTLTALTDSLLADRTLGASSLGARPPTNDSPAEAVNLEHIRQSLLTMHTLMSTMEVASTNARAEEKAVEEKEFKDGEVPLTARQFFQGQWLDVKDTVDQWLEATILSVRGSSLLVHYNGWPSRWDEWIESSSPRIAPFRTRTSHTLNTVSQSPTPLVRPENAPVTGINDVRVLLPSVVSVMQAVVTNLQELSDLYVRHHTHVPQDSTFVRSSSDSTTMASNMPWIHPPNPSVGNWSDSESQRAQLLGSELAPLCDRLGRVLADLGPHLVRVSNPNSQNETQAPATEAGLSFLSRALQSTLSRNASQPASGGADRATDQPYRQLISSNSRGGVGSGLGANHLDIHIHAILTPTSRTPGQTTGSLQPEAPNGATGAHGPALGALRRLARQIDQQNVSRSNNSSLRSVLGVDTLGPHSILRPGNIPLAVPSTAVPNSAAPVTSFPVAVSEMTSTQTPQRVAQTSEPMSSEPQREEQTQTQSHPTTAQSQGQDQSGRSAIYDRIRRLFFDNGQN